mmetsp:Transcript_10299/g.26995  ORF Transcript_10299/g.26995 Transcript_10299/m.26995 type:complete len:91 (-) Transcript_10299:303-575(-)
MSNTIDTVKQFDQHRVSGYSVGFDISADEGLIASGSTDGTVHIYDTRRNRQVRQFSVSKENSPITAVAWHPAGASTIATGDWSGRIFVHS